MDEVHHWDPRFHERDGVTLTLPVEQCTPRMVDRLRRMCEQHPGEQTLVLQLTHDGEAKLLRVAVLVDGSPEFMLKAMGLIDG